MIKWNEGREAKEKCESHNFEYGEKDLTLICKYLGNGEQDKDELENRLLDFCSDCRREGRIQFDPFYQEYMIPFNNAVETASQKRIQDRFPITITLNEWRTIKQIDNEEIQRLLFVMLVVAKYFHILIKRYDLSYTTDYRVDMEDAKIRKLAKVKLHRDSAASRTNYRDWLRDNGYIKLSGRNQIYVLFAEDSGEVIETVTDYDHMDLHFDRLNGESIGMCEKCGQLFRQNKQNNQRLCSDCRGYKKAEPRNCKCLDCGKTFIRMPNNRRKVRCDKCAEEHKKMLKRERNAKYRGLKD